jgi:hypothetical protein
MLVRFVGVQLKYRSARYGGVGWAKSLPPLALSREGD